MKLSLFLASLTVAVAGAAQSVYPGMFAGKMAVPLRGAHAAESYELNDIRLLPGRFRENLERDSAWLMSIPVGSLVHSFHNNAGVFCGREGGYMTVSKLGGWESLDSDLRGHTTGHVMSALGLMYAATGQECFKIKGDSIVAELARVQEALPGGFLSAWPEEFINRNMRGQSVWAPWYTLHKILAGLIDQYLYTGNPQALEVAARMGNWASEKLRDVDTPQRLLMLRNEFGGINEAFYNLYAITGDTCYHRLARFFYHPDVIDPLKAGCGDMGTKHTNTFIPKVIAEARNYELTGDTTSLAAARFFFDEMLAHHTFAPGCLSDKEHFFDPEHFTEHITGYTGETCCTYNMLKLARHLFDIQPSGALMDYYERALYNHILGQQDPATGMVAYFLPLATGTHRVYSTHDNSYWCCVGSGFESHAKSAEQAYSRGTDGDIYVNLYIPSQLTDGRMTITQTTDYPADLSSRLDITDVKPGLLTLKLRRPSWATGMTVRVNGKKVSAKAGADGYVGIRREWKSGDRVEVAFTARPRFEPTPSDPSTGAIIYGPVVLAARLGTDGMRQPAPYSDPALYNDYYTYDYNITADYPDTIDPTGIEKIDALKFRAGDVVLEPLSDIHRERYQVYWKLTGGDK